MDSFQKRIILITGASSGIGVEFAKLLASDGANLILTARSEKKLQELANALSETYGIKVDVFCADLSQPAGPKQLFEEVQKSGNEVDVVINNAGFGKWGNFEAIDFSTYEAMCYLNINAVLALTHLFLPGMIKRGAGGFINVASTAGFQPIPFFATYSATKSFVLNFSEALWAEFKDRGIMVTCLCPGGTATNFHNISKMDPDKLIGLESPEKVAKMGLKAFLKGRPTVISGFKNYVLANSSRFAPRKFVIEVSGGMFKPKN